MQAIVNSTYAPQAGRAPWRELNRQTSGQRAAKDDGRWPALTAGWPCNVPGRPAEQG